MVVRQFMQQSRKWIIDGMEEMVQGRYSSLSEYYWRCAKDIYADVDEYAIDPAEFCENFEREYDESDSIGGSTDEQIAALQKKLRLEQSKVAFQKLLELLLKKKIGKQALQRQRGFLGPVPKEVNDTVEVANEIADGSKLGPMARIHLVQEIQSRSSDTPSLLAEELCAICLLPFQEEEKTSKRMAYANDQCKHLFHTTCIYRYALEGTHPSCPFCRKEIFPVVIKAPNLA